MSIIDEYIRRQISERLKLDIDDVNAKVYGRFSPFLMSAI